MVLVHLDCWRQQAMSIWDGRTHIFTTVICTKHNTGKLAKGDKERWGGSDIYLQTEDYTIPIPIPLLILCLRQLTMYLQRLVITNG